MQSFSEFIREEKVRGFTNWVRPSDKDIELEYKVEYELKGLGGLTNNAFPTVNDFKKAVKSAKTLKITPAIDRNIAYRSRTKSKEQIINLIKGYKSYPQFRNEDTVEAIYQGFRDNAPMKMPFVLKFPDGSMRIMSGNTRTDIAMQLGVTPEAILIEIPEK